MIKEYTTHSFEETEEVGRELARLLDRADIARVFVAMRGEMGVGKTAFTRGFCSYLGIGGVKSPTYTVVNEYRGDRRVFHFDMYRIEDEDDLISIGYDDYVSKDGYCIAEWCENIPFALPEEYLRVSIEKEDVSRPDRRLIRITKEQLCSF